MRRLVGVELTRLRMRRAVLALLLVGVVVPLLVAASQLWDTRPLSDADRAFAAEQAEADYAAALASVDDCVRSPGEFGIPEASGSDAARSSCTLSLADPQWFTADGYAYRPPLDVEAVRTGSAVAVAVVLGLVVVLLGMTFVGADWASGSMSVQLLVEPRRTRVWVAKALATGLVAAGLGTAVLGVFWAVVAVAAEARGIETTAATWGQVVASGLWTVVLLVAATLAAHALTMLLRSTVVTLGIVFAVSVGSTVLLAVLGAGSFRWMLPTNAFAVITGEVEYYDDGCYATVGESRTTVDVCARVLERPESVVYLGVLVALLVAGSLVSFRRRDVP